MAEKRVHDCPCCTCGKIQLTWSDREVWVFPEDLAAMAQEIVYCALDHSYDRGDGVPLGLDVATSDKLRPIIAKHLSAKNPEWSNHTVDLNEDERQHLHDDILAVLSAQ